MCLQVYPIFVRQQAAAFQAVLPGHAAVAALAAAFLAARLFANAVAALVHMQQVATPAAKPEPRMSCLSAHLAPPSLR